MTISEQLNNLYICDEVNPCADAQAWAALFDMVKTNGNMAGYINHGSYEDTAVYTYAHWVLHETEMPQHGGVIEYSLYYHGTCVVSAHLF